MAQWKLKTVIDEQCTTYVHDSRRALFDGTKGVGGMHHAQCVYRTLRDGGRFSKPSGCIDQIVAHKCLYRSKM